MPCFKHADIHRMEHAFHPSPPPSWQPRLQPKRNFYQPIGDHKIDRDSISFVAHDIEFSTPPGVHQFGSVWTARGRIDGNRGNQSCDRRPDREVRSDVGSRRRAHCQQRPRCFSRVAPRIVRRACAADAERRSHSSRRSGGVGASHGTGDGQTCARWDRRSAEVRVGMRFLRRQRRAVSGSRECCHRSACKLRRVHWVSRWPSCPGIFRSGRSCASPHRG